MRDEPIRAMGLASLSALEGHWRLQRKITQADGRTGRFEGDTVFRRTGPRLIQEEAGTLSMEGAPPLKATRRYIWTTSGELLKIAFEDGRPFHAVPAGVTEYDTVYLCPPDRYEVAYDFADMRAWTSRWRVEGPRKDYVMESRFTRL